MRRIIPLLILLFLPNLYIFSQGAPVHFKTGIQHFHSNTDELQSILQLNPDEIYSGKIYRFLQFNQLPDLNRFRYLESLGLEFLEYIPKNVYLVSIPTDFNFSALSQLGVYAIIELKSEYKIDQRLFERPFPVWAMSNAILQVQVQLHQNIDYYKSVELLTNEGYSVFENDNHNKIVHLLINPDHIEKLSKLPYVRYVDLPAHPGTTESDDGRNLHRSNMIDRDYYGSYAFDGTGVNVCVNDDGYAGPHIDFEGRTNQSTVINDLTGNHGDGTAGILGSAGNLNPLYRGMAPGAYMHIRQYQSSLPNTLTLHVDSAVLVFSNSYSDGCNNGYTSTTRKVDQEIYNNPALMQVFSAGNSNGQDCGYGAGTQWGNITGGHKMAKNCIATANLNANDIIATSSSRGPASDGRIKPDISAHGQNQVSNDSDNTYQSFGGTSAACPGIAGILAQLQQAYRTYNSGNNAPSALLKACLLNTANELGNDGPDFIFGWGKVNAYKALKVLEEGRYLLDSIHQGGLNTHTLTIPSNVSRARIMIYWADQESSTSSAINLVNNIDMTVTSSTATVFYPWVLNSNPNATTLALPAVRNGTLDTLNNMEQVAIDNPVAGTYTINVSGSSVPFGIEKYYIVYEFLTDDVTVTFPVGGEGLIPGSTDRIHWDAYGDNGTFLVEISTDNGSSWSTLASAASASSRFLSYTVPNTVSGQCKVRVSRNGFSDESDANFSIIERPQNFRVSSVCNTAGTIRLVWDSVPSASGYDIFKLGTMYMDSVGSTTATTFDVSVPNVNDTYWFAIRAKSLNNCIGLRTNAIQYTGNSFAGECLIDCNNDNDVGIDSIISPLSNQVNCSGNIFNVTVLLENISNNFQTNFPVYYSLNGAAPVMQVYTDTIFSRSNRLFTFNQQLNLTVPGTYNLKIWSNLSNDGALCNDTIEMTVNFNNIISSFPYTEDFQGGQFPPQNSYAFNPDASTGWDLRNCIGTSGTTTAAMYIENFYYSAMGQEDIFGLNSFDLSAGLQAAILSFDLSYAQYSSTYKDSLIVELSTDCGLTFFSVYAKTGGFLATTGNSTSSYTPNSAAQWRKENIDLTPYIGSDVAVRFRAVNGYGNNLYIDNINVESYNSFPTAVFEVSSQTACVGESVNFSDLSSDNPTSWTWDFGDGNSSTSQNPSNIYQNAGVYDVSLIVNNPVGADTLQQSAYITVIDANFSDNAADGLLTVNFIDLSSGANSWTWDFGDGNSSTQQNPTHTYAAAGNYTVILTVNGLCVFSKIVAVGTVSVESIDAQNGFELFPNPAENSVRIGFVRAAQDEIQLQVISVDAREIKNAIIPANSVYYDLNCSDINSGIYFLRLKNGDRVMSKKLVIKR